MECLDCASESLETMNKKQGAVMVDKSAILL